MVRMPAGCGERAQVCEYACRAACQCRPAKHFERGLGILSLSGPGCPAGTHSPCVLNWHAACFDADHL